MRPVTRSRLVTLDSSGFVPAAQTPVTGFAVTAKVFADSPVAVAASDRYLVCDPVGGNMTVNLPAVAASSGRVLNVKHGSGSANTVTVDGAGAETIDGLATLILGTRAAAILLCDGVEWHIL